MTTPTPLTLFGTTTNPWLPPPWHPTSDQLRGGISTSQLTLLPNSSSVLFHGHLDTTTLGGAGFASQFSPVDAGSFYNSDDDSNNSNNGEDKSGEDKSGEGNGKWDLSAYDGLEIEVGKGDGKVYTLILKDEKQKGGEGDKAGISWEVQFKGGDDGSEGDATKKIWMPWRDFKATYRGKEVESPGELKTAEVRRVGVMMRSYFDKQDGDFSIELKSIVASRSQAMIMNDEVQRVLDRARKPIEKRRQGGGE